MRAKRLLIAGLLIGVLLMSCMDSMAVPENVAVEDYPSPALTTPTAERNISIKISPSPIDQYLPNPGIGWQNGPEAFDILEFPETVKYSDRKLIAWAKLNPAEGVYDWSALEEQLNQAIRDGKQFSFRVYTHIGEHFGGHMIPGWVLAKGAMLLSSGEPDYSSCVYQEAWGRFVTELARVYDGNPNIAFIDISGYGNFNEWSWQNAQTKWDEQWRLDYENGLPSPQSFQTLDGQARRRLADIFIGGSFDGHVCRTASGQTARANYAYQGFQKTQLLMPYAGIVQSSQYVYSRRQDIGFRHDCLGRDGHTFFEEIGDQIDKVWKRAPIVLELCGPDQTDLNNIRWLLGVSHPSLVHNNHWKYSRDELQELMLNIGYRYLLKTADFDINGRRVALAMEWQNIGSAPNYPKMGQEFELYFYLLDSSGRPVLRELIPIDTSLWLPASEAQQEAPSYLATYNSELPSLLAAGTYQVAIAILDTRTGEPIQLSFDGRNKDSIYILSSITIQ